MSDEVVLIEDTVERVITSTEFSVVVEEDDRVVVISEGQQGPQGPPGLSGTAEITAIASATVGGHRAVIMSGQGEVAHADNLTIDHIGRVVGVSLSAALTGDPLTVKTIGEIVEASWNWTPHLPIYVGSDGLLIQSAPVLPAAFSLIVGFATSPTSMYVDVREPVFLS